MLGYSIKFVDQVKKADPEKPGVKLGLLCVDRDIPAATVARHLKVSRMTVYMWFTGRTLPNKNSHLPRIKELISDFHNIEW